MANEGDLSEFVDELGKADHSNNDTFQYFFFQGAELLQLDNGKIYDLFHYKEDDLSQWKKGRNLPHRGVRRAIFKILEELAQKRLG